MKLSFDTLNETPLPEHIKEKLEGAGFDTPSKVLSATDEELLLIPGIGRKMLNTIRLEVRPALDKALDPFRLVAEKYFKSFRTDYPEHSIVLLMQDKPLTVRDFLKLYRALNEENND